MTKLAFFLSILFAAVFPASAQIEQVEPPNWWIGMKDPQVQILVHGKNIGQTTPTLQYPGVTLVKVNTADNPNYLFLDLSISPKTKAGHAIIRFSKNGKTVDSVGYLLKKRLPNADQLKGFDASDVVYLVVPDRFVNGNDSNDVVPEMLETKIDRNDPGGRHGGDIRGMIDRLDYVHDMGFTAIWPTPLLENNMPAYSYHGYAITNHYRVDPRYGNLNDYVELATKARQKGIKLIFDEVLNHSGTNYWWKNDLPFNNWFNHPEKYTPTHHRRTANQDPYASSYDKDLMTNGWFDVTMADMNARNPFMANYLIQCSIWWIETLQLGGIRQDTWGYSDQAFLTRWSCRIMREYPQFNMVGEEWSLNPLITSYWQQGKNNKNGFQDCLKTVMDFPMQDALIKGLTEKDVPYTGKGFTRLYEGLANDIAYPEPQHLLVLGDNHDMDRLMTQLNGDWNLTQMAIGYLLTTRGIPQIMYGTEIGMENMAHPGHHGYIRSDFPGGWKSDTVNAFTSKGLSNQQKNLQQYVQQLLQWRKQHPVIANGKTLHFAPFDDVYVYFRYNAKDTVMVVMNKDIQPKTFSLLHLEEMLQGKKTAMNAITKQTVVLDKELTVPATSTTVFEIR